MSEQASFFRRAWYCNENWETSKALLRRWQG